MWRSWIQPEVSPAAALLGLRARGWIVSSQLRPDERTRSGIVPSGKQNRSVTLGCDVLPAR
jgi:hypothetical protein